MMIGMSSRSAHIVSCSTAAARNVSPAPSRSAVCFWRSAKICFARLTAAKATETGLLLLAVYGARRQRGSLHA